MTVQQNNVDLLFYHLCFLNFTHSDICPGDISGYGKAFIVALSFSGLGMFCGPLMNLASSSWKRILPVGGTVALLSSTIAVAIFIFSYLLEEMSESEAAYFSIITGMSSQVSAGTLYVRLQNLNRTPFLFLIANNIKKERPLATETLVQNLTWER